LSSKTQKLSNFDEIQFIYSFLVNDDFGVISKSKSWWSGSRGKSACLASMRQSSNTSTGPKKKKKNPRSGQTYAFFLRGIQF
jgi:hypothetical protein